MSLVVCPALPWETLDEAFQELKVGNFDTGCKTKHPVFSKDYQIPLFNELLTDTISKLQSYHIAPLSKYVYEQFQRNIDYQMFLSMRSLSLLDEESQRRLRPTDSVKMDRNCIISVIQVIGFVLSTNSSWLPSIDLWKKLPWSTSLGRSAGSYTRGTSHLAGTTKCWLLWS